MSTDDHQTDTMLDDATLALVRDRLGRMSLPGPAPLEQVLAHGRTHRRTRRITAGVGATLTLGLALTTSAFLHRIEAPDATGPTASRTVRPVHIHLAAFSVDTTADGKVTATITFERLFQPDALRAALEQAGVPTRIVSGAATTCFTPGPAQPDRLNDVETHHREADGTTVIVIDPSKIPTGEALAVIYAPGASPEHHIVLTTLIRADAKQATCPASKPVPDLNLSTDPVPHT